MSRSAAVSSGFQMSKIRIARGVSDRFQASWLMVSSNTQAWPGHPLAGGRAHPEAAARRNDQRHVHRAARVGDPDVSRNARVGIEHGEERGRRTLVDKTARRGGQQARRSPGSGPGDWARRWPGSTGNTHSSAASGSVPGTDRAACPWGNRCRAGALRGRRPGSATAPCASRWFRPRRHRARGSRNARRTRSPGAPACTSTSAANSRVCLVPIRVSRHMSTRRSRRPL